MLDVQGEWYELGNLKNDSSFKVKTKQKKTPPKARVSHHSANDLLF